MGILVYNHVGLIATLVVYVPLFLIVERLEVAGWTGPQAMALLFVGGTTFLSVFALFWDRRDHGNLFRTYWANYRQVVYTSMDSFPPTFEFDDRRRTAMLLVPLALAPFFVLAGYFVLLVHAYTNGEETTWGVYGIGSLASCGLTWVIAAIQDHRGSSNLLGR